jgi:hypothetical protein
MPAPEWVQAGADVFSAVGTVGAFAIGFVLFRREHMREESHVEEERRSQAAKVSAWVEAHRSGDRTEIYFHVHNASDMPIYETALPIPARPGEPSGSEFIGLVPPGQTIMRQAPSEWLKSYYSPEPVEIEFLDSSGWLWTRDEQGFLYRNPERISPGPHEPERAIEPKREQCD